MLTSPSLATSGVISSLSDTSLITCCMKCARIGQCAGIFYDSDSARCKHYSFQNYTSMNIAGVQNFVKVIPGIISKTMPPPPILDNWTNDLAPRPLTENILSWYYVCLDKRSYCCGFVLFNVSIE